MFKFVIIGILLSIIIIINNKQKTRPRGNGVLYNKNIKINYCRKTCKNDLLSYFPTNVECSIWCWADSRPICKCYEQYKENIALCMCL